MSTRLAEAVTTHQHPRVFFRHPRLLSVLHGAVRATTLRTWYVHHALSKVLASLEEPFRYLDAGCGAGDFLLPYARQFPASAFVGLDRIADNVALCARYCAEKGLPNVALQQADLEDVVPDPPADVIACITVLQYTANDRQVLDNFYRGLKENGLLLLYVPVHNERFFRWYGPLLDRYFRKAHYDTARQPHRLYTPEDLTEKLHDAGFRITASTFAYGTAGKIYYEVYSLSLMALSSLPWPLALLLTPLLVLIYPILLVLMGIDFLKPHRRGNGLLLLARKQARKPQAVPS